MAAPPHNSYITPEEYLTQERKAEFKSEYIGGQIVVMTGAGREHNLIPANILRVLSSQLLDRPCEAYVSDMRVRVRTSFAGKAGGQGTYTYPDVTIVCGDPQMKTSRWIHCSIRR